MRLWVRNNSLSLVFLVLFLVALVGQSIAGHRVFNEEQLQHGGETVSYTRYLVSSHFGSAVLENWQSEYLQFTVFIFLTIWLVQRGSSESKKPGDEGRETDKKQLVGRYAREDSPAWARAGGWRTAVYSHSLLITMTAVFVLAWVAQAVAGRVAHNEERMHDFLEPLTLGQYIGSPDFWGRTFQNWQSEMLAIASMAVFSIYLRERGSPESKPVGLPHDATASDE